MSKKTAGLWYTAADEPGEFVDSPEGQERCDMGQYSITIEPMQGSDNYRMFIWDGNGTLVYERWYYDNVKQAKQAARWWVNYHEKVRA